MTRYEYKAIPAPTRGEKARGAKTPADRFAHAMTSLMNEMGAEGWEYIRADTLPAEERAGFTRKVTVYQNILTFRRALPAAKAEVLQPTERAPRAAEPEAPAPARPLTAAAPVPDTAPRISIRDESFAPTIKLGAAAPRRDLEAATGEDEATGS